GALLAIAFAIPGPKVEALTVTGQAREKGAGSLAGATVSLFPMAEPVTAKGVVAEPPQALAVLATKGDGSFRLSIERPDFYLLRIEAPGFGPVEHRLAPLLRDLHLPVLELAPAGSKPAAAAPRPAPVAATPSRFLAGRLVSARDGSPIRRGLVWSADQPAFFARSDDQGKFRLA